jgi:hypothetical protein
VRRDVEQQAAARASRSGLSARARTNRRPSGCRDSRRAWRAGWNLQASASLAEPGPAVFARKFTHNPR